VKFSRRSLKKSLPTEERHFDNVDFFFGERCLSVTRRSSHASDFSGKYGQRESMGRHKGGIRSKYTRKIYTRCVRNTSILIFLAQV